MGLRKGRRGWKGTWSGNEVRQISCNMGKNRVVLSWQDKRKRCSTGGTYVKTIFRRICSAP